MSIFSRYASFVKAVHSIFALPFAGLVFVYASRSVGFWDWWVLAKIVLAMVLARSAAMSFNRWADRSIDARNPRTANREIPMGLISARSALRFAVICSALFVGLAFRINLLCGWLSPVALILLLGYSYTKRFSALSHYVLGIAQAAAPIGVFIAVTGSWHWGFAELYPLLVGAVVMSWMAGFDTLYALLDVEFDRREKLYSLPSRTTPLTAAIISIFTHIISLYGVILLGQLYGGGVFYWLGVGVFAMVLVVQHVLYTPRHVERIGRTFALVNGCASIVFAFFAIFDLLING